jgi:hypothetical protein
MKVKKLLTSRLTRATALLGLSLLPFSSIQAQTNVTVDTGDTWIGGMVVYQNTPGQEYMWYSDWGIADVKTDINTTNNTITLYPNYNVYGTGDDPTYWTNGDTGNKIMQGLSYTIDDSLLGQNFTFSGNVASNTLASGYIAKAFVKVTDANFQQIVELLADLDEGNFTIPCNAADYAGAAHVQYGFYVRGINANPTAMAANGNIVIEGDEAEEPEEPTAVELTINTASPLIAYANWFELDGTTYVNGSTWDVATLKTVVDTENDVIDLHPNFNAYADEVANDPTSTYWHNGDVGAKIFEANTYVDDAQYLGQAVNFSGHCISNSLTDDYDAIAFIKVLDAGFQLVNYTHVPLVAGEDFSIDVNTALYPTGAHFQYGYSVTGINANPTQETALGYARVGNATAGVKGFDKKAVAVYPNPANSTLNITAGDVMESIQIFNLMGQKVMEAAVNQNTTTLNISGLNSGMYIITATVNGQQSTTRFVKQ